MPQVLLNAYGVVRDKKEPLSDNAAPNAPKLQPAPSSSSSQNSTTILWQEDVIQGLLQMLGTVQHAPPVVSPTYAEDYQLKFPTASAPVATWPYSSHTAYAALQQQLYQEQNKRRRTTLDALVSLASKSLPTIPFSNMQTTPTNPFSPPPVYASHQGPQPPVRQGGLWGAGAPPPAPKQPAKRHPSTIAPRAIGVAETIVVGDNVTAKLLFRKQLTMSDCSKAGRVVFPRSGVEGLLVDSARMATTDGTPYYVSLNVFDTDTGTSYSWQLKRWTQGPLSRGVMYVAERAREWAQDVSISPGDYMAFYIVEGQQPAASAHGDEPPIDCVVQLYKSNMAKMPKTPARTQGNAPTKPNALPTRASPAHGGPPRVLAGAPAEAPYNSVRKASPKRPLEADFFTEGPPRGPSGGLGRGPVSVSGLSGASETCTDAMAALAAAALAAAAKLGN